MGVMKGVDSCCDLSFRMSVRRREDEDGVIEVDDGVPDSDGVRKRTVSAAAGAALQLALEQVRRYGVREMEGVLLAAGGLGVGFREGERVPIPECDWVQGGGVEGCHVDVVFVAENAGVEDGGTNVVVVEVSDWEVVGEVGGWRDVGVVREFRSHECVEYPVDCHRGI